MNISSYNITDVTYHYIGLRVLDGMPPTSKRTEQIEAVASNVLKFVSDRNQRLMVAAPGTTYQGTAKKISRVQKSGRIERPASKTTISVTYDKNAQITKSVTLRVK